MLIKKQLILNESFPRLKYLPLTHPIQSVFQGTQQKFATKLSEKYFNSSKINSQTSEQSKQAVINTLQTISHFQTLNATTNSEQYSHTTMNEQSTSEKTFSTYIFT